MSKTKTESTTRLIRNKGSRRVSSRATSAGVTIATKASAIMVPRSQYCSRGWLCGERTQGSRPVLTSLRVLLACDTHACGALLPFGASALAAVGSASFAILGGGSFEDRRRMRLILRHSNGTQPVDSRDFLGSSCLSRRPALFTLATGRFRARMMSAAVSWIWPGRQSETIKSGSGSTGSTSSLDSPSSSTTQEDTPLLGDVSRKVTPDLARIMPNVARDATDLPRTQDGKEPREVAG
mmetsp:Transcript_81792/g.252538  ORF Transcript_81792/g.252538 Transcript_81792/m.252538 type:complete len:238 (+) Transcript_81792:1565-2278(+)